MSIMSKLRALLEKIENNKILAGFVLVLYVFLLCFVSYYHEPWHDEGQAWLIARDDSIWHLITVTTHYEGHPPLWHLILMPFAKMGVPFELGIKSINITFCSIAMWLLICKSPLPFYLRYSLPFTYFFFYQYGVINRTYSLLMLAMMLAAYYYPSRQRQPFKLALVLSALGGSMAYGAMITLGIALSWFGEIVGRKYKEGQKSIKSFVREPELKALGMLLLISLFWAYCIIPRSDTAFISSGLKTDSISGFLFTFFMVPGQALCNNDFNYAIQGKAMEFFLSNIRVYWQMVPETGIYAILVLSNYLVSYIYGVLIQLSFCYITYTGGKLPIYLLPMFCYALLASYVHWVPYHAGIMVAFFAFVLWQLFADKDNMIMLEQHFKKKFVRKNEYVFLKGFSIFAVLVCMFIGISWSFTSSSVDVKNSYDISRDVANFIKENKLENYNIWSSWEYKGDSQEDVYFDSYAINAYFKKPMIKNENGGEGTIAYHQYKVINKARFLNELKALPKPDFLIGSVQLNEIDEHPDSYVKIKSFSGTRSWKNATNISGEVFLYIREDLLPQFPQFHRLENED